MLYRHSNYSQFVIPTNARLYHYAGNNPVKYVDPDGRDVVWATLGQSGFSHNAPQRVFGFNDRLDDYSRIAGFDLYATSFETENFTLRLWRGNYSNPGLLELVLYMVSPLLSAGYCIWGGAGGEVGLYNSDGTSMSLNDLSSLGITNITLEVFNKNSKTRIGFRNENPASFWTTVFSWFDSSRKEDLYTKSTFTFKSRRQALSFKASLKAVQDVAKEYPHNANGTLNITSQGRRITITWGKDE